MIINWLIRLIRYIRCPPLRYVSQWGIEEVFYISLDDVNVKNITDNSQLAVNIDDSLYFPQYNYDNNAGLIVRNLTGYKTMFSGKKLIIKSDSIDVKEENDELITTLTLTGLKKKDTDTRDFVGEIASYQDDLIKVDRSNPDNPTVEFLSFENSQYKGNYEREERIKLLFIPFDI